jgi:hypothetical protein
MSGTATTRPLVKHSTQGPLPERSCRISTTRLRSFVEATTSSSPSPAETMMPTADASNKSAHFSTRVWRRSTTSKPTTSVSARVTKVSTR